LSSLSGGDLLKVCGRFVLASMSFDALFLLLSPDINRYSPWKMGRNKRGTVRSPSFAKHSLRGMLEFISCE
jgi:hypothetical protein